MQQPTFLREMNPQERANADLILRHFDRWRADYDPEESYRATFHQTARCRAESNKLSPLQWDMANWRLGMEQMIAASKQYLASGMKVTTTIHELNSCGPMVTVSRTDYCTQPGRPDRVIKAVGIFMIFNGKVAEWSDWFADRDENGDGAG